MKQRFQAGFLAIVLGAIGATTSIAQPTGGNARRPSSLTIESMSGRDSFEFYCAPCHGRDGQGAGPVAAALNAHPANLTTLARWANGQFPRDEVIAFVTGTGREVSAHGTTEMPVWGPTFRSLDPSDARVKARIEAVVDYIESIQVK